MRNRIDMLPNGNLKITANQTTLKRLDAALKRGDNPDMIAWDVLHHATVFRADQRQANTLNFVSATCFGAGDDVIASAVQPGWNENVPVAGARLWGYLNWQVQSPWDELADVGCVTFTDITPDQE